MKQRSELGAAWHRQMKARRVAEYDSNPSRCKRCDAALPYEKRKNKFCCHSCAASSNNVGVRRHGEPGMDVKCLNCGGVTTNTKFCKLSCCREYQKSDRERKLFETGVLNCGPRRRKASLINVRGHRCEVCGLSEWMGKEMPLVCDHINGNSEDNRVENLRLLCGNCNMQTDTFAGRNPKGSGRFYRRQLYRQGRAW